MESLEHLDLSGTALKELPTSVENLIGLVKLSLENCENLVCLPESLFKLKSLMKLCLGGCSRLEKFPEILEAMERLRILDLSGTTLKELPSSMENLFGLNDLTLDNCENLVRLPDNLFPAIGGASLTGGSGIQKHRNGLSSLTNLSLRECKRLKSLPELPPSLEVLDAPGCTSLEDVSSIKRHFEKALPCRACISGSEVPQWFEFKSVGSSINIPLPWEWYNNRRKKFQGFVVSAVISIQDHSGDMIHIQWECRLKSCNDDRLNLSFPSVDSRISGMHHEHGLLESNHLFISCNDNIGRHFFETWASNGHMYNGVSFQFYAHDYNWPHSSWKVKQCGAHPLFAEDGAGEPPPKRLKYGWGRGTDGAEVLMGTYLDLIRVRWPKNLTSDPKIIDDDVRRLIQ